MVARERMAYERGERINWIRLSNAFHVEMARLLDNQVLVETLHSLCARTTLIIAHYDTPGHTPSSWHEHAEILIDDDSVSEITLRWRREWARVAADDESERRPRPGF